jgi:hypothetical protein
MFIRSGNQRICLNVNHSSLIWKVNKTTNTLSVAAIANKRPDLNSKVYFAPLMNVHSNLSVCQGTARIPQFGTLSQSVIKSVEACLLDSNFTSLHFDALRNESNVASSKTNHVTFWKKKSLANQAPKLSELKIFGTLADFIRG